MKLIELLARELKEWPEGAEWAQQSKVDCEIYFRPADTCDFYASARADDYIDAKVTREQWENATNQPHDPIPGSTDTPTLETMLAEWRDIEARAQVAQAEADALFEHAGQLHGEIVVRLAELGWGATRGPMVPGEPVVTLNEPKAFVALSEDWWKHVKVGDMLTYCVGDGKYHNVGSFTDGQSYRVTDIDGNDNTFPWELKCDDGELELWGSPDYFTPSTQP